MCSTKCAQPTHLLHTHIHTYTHSFSPFTHTYTHILTAKQLSHDPRQLDTKGHRSLTCVAPSVHSRPTFYTHTYTHTLTAFRLLHTHTHIYSQLSSCRMTQGS